MGSMLNIASRMEGPEQKTIIGKIGVTVSAKGIANGTSVYINDGADFGPDTKLGATTLGQYGPPFTVTLGFAEAIEYAQSNGIGKISSLPANKYVFTSPLYLNPNGTYTNSLEIDGHGSIFTYPSSSTFDLIQVSNNPNNTTGQPMYPIEIHGFLFDGAGSTNYNGIHFNQYGNSSSDPTVKISIHDNVFRNGFFQHVVFDNASNSIDVFDNVFINPAGGGCVYINGSDFPPIVRNNFFIAGALSAGSNAVGFQNNENSSTTLGAFSGGYVLANYFTNLSDAPTSNLSGAIEFGNGTTSGWNGCIIENNILNLTAGWVNSVEEIGGIADNIIVSKNIFQTNATIVLSGQRNDCSENIFLNGCTTFEHFRFSRNTVYQPTSLQFGLSVNAGTAYTEVSENYFINNSTVSGNAAIQWTSSTTGSQPWVINDNVFAGSSTGTINFGTATLSQFISVQNNRGAIYQPTTPTVPTSGTAQTNDNPYSVNVYIYGGTITAIDYTPAGGAAIEVGTTGPATVKLNPGDSITLTYSAAPSWKWTTA